MYDAMVTVINFICSPWVAGFAFIAICISALLLLDFHDNSGWKRFVGILVGCVLFLAAPKITKKLVTDLFFPSTAATSAE